MEYNDEKMPSVQAYEEMAKAYCQSQHTKQLLANRFNDEEINMLCNEIVIELESVANILRSASDPKLDSILQETQNQIAFFRKNYNINTQKTLCKADDAGIKLVSLELCLGQNLVRLACKQNFDEIIGIANKRIEFYGLI